MKYVTLFEAIWKTIDTFCYFIEIDGGFNFIESILKLRWRTILERFYGVIGRFQFVERVKKFQSQVKIDLK